MNHPETADTSVLSMRSVFLIFVGVLAGSLIIGFVPSMIFGFSETASRWGDSFGFVNAILSGLAFAAVIITLWLQKSELRLQREELEATREQLKRSAEAQEASEKRLFLTAYLNALDSFREIAAMRMNSRQRVLNATYPVVQGVVFESRVWLTLEKLLPQLDPEMKKLFPAIEIALKGHRQWVLERLWECTRKFAFFLDFCEGSTTDQRIQEVCELMSEIQETSTTCRPYLNHSRSEAVGRFVNSLPVPNFAQYQTPEQRTRLWGEVRKVKGELLSVILIIAHEED